MIITVNGKAHKHGGKANVQGLLKAMRIDSSRVAVMVNGQIVRRQKFPSARLAPGDSVEILTLAGGG